MRRAPAENFFHQPVGIARQVAQAARDNRSRPHNQCPDSDGTTYFASNFFSFPWIRSAWHPRFRFSSPATRDLPTAPLPRRSALPPSRPSLSERRGRRLRPGPPGFEPVQIRTQHFLRFGFNSASLPRVWLTRRITRISSAPGPSPCTASGLDSYSVKIFVSLASSPRRRPCSLPPSIAAVSRGPRDSTLGRDARAWQLRGRAVSFPARTRMLRFADPFFSRYGLRFIRARGASRAAFCARWFSGCSAPRSAIWLSVRQAPRSVNPRM